MLGKIEQMLPSEAPAVTPDGRSPGADSPAADINSVHRSLQRRRDTLGAGWDAEARQAKSSLPLVVEVVGPMGRAPLAEAAQAISEQHDRLAGLLDRKQSDALAELLQGLIATEIAEKTHGAAELVDLMNKRLASVTTAHEVGVRLRWRRSPELDAATARMVELLATRPDLRLEEAEHELRSLLSARLDEARLLEPDTPYRQLIAATLNSAQYISNQNLIGYTHGVTKRLVDIDDDLLAEARVLTGAATMKEAVNAALQRVIDSELRRRHLRRLESGAGTDLADDEVMRGAWR